MKTQPTVQPLKHETLLKLILAHKKDAEMQGPTVHKWISWYHSRQSGRMDSGTRAAIAHNGDEDSYDQDLSVHNNYVYSYMDQMVSNICPQNPQVTVETGHDDVRDAAEAREQLANHFAKADKLHVKLRKATLWASLTGSGYCKVLWDPKKQRPTVKNLHSMKLWYDYTVPFEDSRYYIEVVTLTEEEAKERFANGTYDADLEEELTYAQYPAWLYDESGDRASNRIAARESMRWTTIYEVYDAALNTVVHISEELDQPLNSKIAYPYKWMKPYHSLVFNEDFETSLGVSDIQLISSALDRVNEIDTLELEHGHTSIPQMLVNETMLENPEQFKQALAQSTEPGGMITFRTTNNVPIDDVIGYTPVSGMPPSFQLMRDRLTNLIESVLGIPQYMRGATSGGDVATEFALIDTAAQTRNGRRRDCLDDLIVDLIEAAVTVWEQKMEQEQPVMTMVDRMTRGRVITVDDIIPRTNDTDENKFVYRALAMSPTENHRLVQLQQLVSYLPTFAENPAIDNLALMRKLTKLLGMEEVLNKNPPPDPLPNGAPMGAPGQKGPPQGPGPGPSGEDTIASGAVPGGLDEALLPPGARGLADQPRVEF